MVSRGDDDSITNEEDTRIGPDDRISAILNRRFNKRFCARPDYIMAVRLDRSDRIGGPAGGDRRTAPRRTSGGHSLEDLVRSECV